MLRTSQGPFLEDWEHLIIQKNPLRNPEELASFISTLEYRNVML